MPLGEGPDKCVDPLADASLGGVDLLTTPDKANDDRPIRMSVEARYKELGL